MDLQTMLDNAVAVQRSNRMKTSVQLTLGELILKLEIVKNKNLPVIYDVKKYFPTDIDSWRGSYCELALDYTDNEETAMLLVKDLIRKLKKTVGKTFTGYKGGDFIMGRQTPVWVANYSTSNGFRRSKKSGNDTTAIVDVLEKKDKVVIKTKQIDY